jgi:hypothetical protein
MQGGGFKLQAASFFVHLCAFAALWQKKLQAATSSCIYVPSRLSGKKINSPFTIDH